jgi:hypothetical protein
MAKRTIEIHKANGPVSDAEIRIFMEQPQSGAGANALFERDADALEDVLNKSLPGGTYDRLLICMLQRRASIFRVAFSPGP